MWIYIYIQSKSKYKYDLFVTFTVPTTMTNVIIRKHKFTLANRDPSV